MDTDSLPGSPMLQVVLPRLIAEVRAFSPGLLEFSHLSIPHHLLSARLTPKPHVSVGCFEQGRESESLSNLGGIVFQPAALPIHTRHRLDDSPIRVICLHFEPGYFAEMFEREGISCDPVTMASLDLHDLHMRRGMQRLAEEVMAPGFASTYLVESIATGVLVQLGRSAGETSRAGVRGSGGLAAWQLRTIRDHLEDRAEGVLPSASELAALTQLSTRHLRRAFRASTGQKISQYIFTVRLERAKSLLSETSFPLKDIAVRLRFSGADTFSVAFQRATGITPSAYRRLYAKGARSRR